jgi:hypothetical protein
MFSENTSASANNIQDAILKKGAFSAAVSTYAASADVYTLDLVFTIEGSDFGDSGDHTRTYEDVECSIAFSEGEPNTFTVSGTVYGAITLA